MDPSLDKAIQAAKAKDYRRARDLLKAILTAEPDNELAWLWMSQVVKTDRARLKCVHEVLRINPGNKTALRGLRILESRVSEVKQKPRKSSIKPKSNRTTDQTLYSRLAVLLFMWITITGCLVVSAIAILYPSFYTQIESQIAKYLLATRKEAVMVEGQDLELDLADSAHILIHAGTLDAGEKVTFEKRRNVGEGIIVPEGLEIGPVYSVNVEVWDSDLRATITLPLEDLSSEEMEGIQLAYYNEGEWLTVPSSVNIEESTISGTFHHFTDFAWVRRIWNKPPDVAVEVEPNIYSNITFVEKWNTDLEDLKVTIHAHDPEGKPLRVSIAYGFETLVDQTVYEMNFLRERMGKLMDLEVQITAREAEHIYTQARAGLAPKAKHNMVTTDYYDISPVHTGLYKHTFPLRELELNNLEKIQVFVRVEDDLAGSPYENDDLIIRVLSEDILEPPSLIHPENSTLTICPPMPVLEWSYTQDTHLWVESLQLRIVKGDDLWGARFPKRKWECTGNCQPGFESSWTVEKPLPEGKYTWGIAVSEKEHEPDFDADHISYSDKYHFIVDESLTGDRCHKEEMVEPAQFCTPDASTSCLSVVVNDNEGVFVEGVNINLHDATGSVSAPLTGGKTDSKGMFTFSLAPGDYYIFTSGYSKKLGLNQLPAWTGSACQFIIDANKTYEYSIVLPKGLDGTISCANLPAVLMEVNKSENILVPSKAVSTEKPVLPSSTKTRTLLPSTSTPIPSPTSLPTSTSTSRPSPTFPPTPTPKTYATCPPIVTQPFLGMPGITVVNVVRNGTVTVQTKNFPPNTDYVVKMGLMGTRGIDGIEVGRFNTGDGGAFERTFNIPSGLYDEEQIAIRIEFFHEDGYYTYNWFNNSDNFLYKR